MRGHRRQKKNVADDIVDRDTTKKETVEAEENTNGGKYANDVIWRVLLQLVTARWIAEN